MIRALIGSYGRVLYAKTFEGYIIRNGKVEVSRQLIRGRNGRKE